MTIQFLYPEIILFVLSLGALIAGVTPSLRKFTGFIAFGAILAALTVLPSVSYSSTKAFFGLFEADGISAIFSMLILIGTAFIVLLSMGKDRSKNRMQGNIISLFYVWPFDDVGRFFRESFDDLYRH